MKRIRAGRITGPTCSFRSSMPVGLMCNAISSSNSISVTLYTPSFLSVSLCLWGSLRSFESHVFCDIFWAFATILLAPLAARGNDMRGATDFGPRGGKATARRLLAGADERARVPKR
jgi:hypothetical protein